MNTAVGIKFFSEFLIKKLNGSETIVNILSSSIATLEQYVPMS